VIETPDRGDRRLEERRGADLPLGHLLAVAGLPSHRQLRERTHGRKSTGYVGEAEQSRTSVSASTSVAPVNSHPPSWLWTTRARGSALDVGAEYLRVQGRQRSVVYKEADADLQRCVRGARVDDTTLLVERRSVDAERDRRRPGRVISIDDRLWDGRRARDRSAVPLRDDRRHAVGVALEDRLSFGYRSLTGMVRRGAVAVAVWSLNAVAAL